MKRNTATKTKILQVKNIEKPCSFDKNNLLNHNEKKHSKDFIDENQENTIEESSFLQEKDPKAQQELREQNIEKVFKRKRTPQSLTQLLKVTNSLPDKDCLENWVKEFEKDGVFTEKEILDAFKLYDEDDNGHINRKELRNVIDLIGESMTDSELEELVREADINGDGAINYQEFVNMVLSEKY